jgi:hypothetical protein
MSLPGTEEGIACEGTALECASFRVGKKTYLFAADQSVRVKLDASLPEAVRLAAEEPARYKAGSGGWVQAFYGDDASPTSELLTRWIKESHALAASKKTAARAKPRRKRS